MDSASECNDVIYKFYIMDSLTSKMDEKWTNLWVYYLLSLVSDICEPIKRGCVYGGLDVEVGDYRGNVWAML